MLIFYMGIFVHVFCSCVQGFLGRSIFGISSFFFRLRKHEDHDVEIKEETITTSTTYEIGPIEPIVECWSLGNQLSWLAPRGEEYVGEGRG